ncbi:hypothetical protein GUJ93_ZPchr0003g17480 [Zizania palustris]|uniref:Uncharacterized protein n=1 Tax=Zizania palustris TaxID=103762 RepID=A0A8J5VY16_ZIZPA|nr:hypothetical protein GUJ93_ZPchr0003g17480 [Zizania palustris]
MGSPGRGRRDVASVSAPETDVAPGAWGKVSAVLFDMDGVLCNSEEPSRLAGVDVFAEMGVEVTGDDFVPYMGTGEANFLGGVARVKGVKDFNPESAKKRFFEIYLDKYAKPNSGIGFPGALELIMECKNAGLKVAVASSADRVKVDANLVAAGLPVSLFDAIVSADAFENLKPAPDIFLSASKNLGVDTTECIVIEDTLAGVQAATAAEMRCIAVMTTLQEDVLHQASPSLIRKDIGNISIRDILYGGSNAYHNEWTENTENITLSWNSVSKKNSYAMGLDNLGYKNGPALSAQQLKFPMCSTRVKRLLPKWRHAQTQSGRPHHSLASFSSVVVSARVCLLPAPSNHEEESIAHRMAAPTTPDRMEPHGGSNDKRL